jgi:hypothetical protein
MSRADRAKQAYQDSLARQSADALAADQVVQNSPEALRLSQS